MSSRVSPPPQTSPYALVQHASCHNKGCLKPTIEEREENVQTLSSAQQENREEKSHTLALRLMQKTEGGQWRGPCRFNSFLIQRAVIQYIVINL